MRNDPLFLLWVIDCPSPEECRRIPDWVRGELTPQTTVVDEGREVRRKEPHPLGDHFDSIQVWPTPEHQSTSFRLLFHRRPDAGRVWKDLVARALQQVREKAAHTTTTLEYRGDAPPRPLASSI